MNKLFRKLCVFVIFGISIPVFAVQIEFHTFDDPQTEKLYLDLIAELRCVKCQNQNLAESEAEIAKDMRAKTYDLVIAGKSREDVVNYMTARYGDFVLYKPPLKFKTLFLWMGPPLLLFFSLFIIVKYLKNQSKVAVDELSDSDLESVRNLLKSSNEK